jgi:hypothetical protein
MNSHKQYYHYYSLRESRDGTIIFDSGTKTERELWSIICIYKRSFSVCAW